MISAGNYANLRSGNEFASIIRIMEPKPLRVYVHDDSNDQSTHDGGRFLDNQQLYEALKYSGYDATFVIDAGESNSTRGTFVLSDALR